MELITVKIVEVQHNSPSVLPAIKGHIIKGARTHYVLGKRRNYKTPEQIKKGQLERDRVDREGQQ